MKRSTKYERKRNQGFIVIATYLGFLFLLPLGLYAFEIARIYLCQNQLRAVTDAAALAGATYLADPSNADLQPAEALKKAKEVALLYIKRNGAASCSLKDAELSESVDKDEPKAGKSSCDLLYDEDKKIVTAKAVLGVEPAFGRFLGISAVPVHAQSHAGVGKLEGDVVIVFDLSRSMGFATKSVWIERSYDPITKKLTHKIKKSLRTNTSAKDTLPAFPNKRFDVVPDPAYADFSVSPKLKGLANASIETKLAALVEAKDGHLETQQAFETSHSNDTELPQYIRPEPGFQDDYQKIALAATQPLADAKTALNEFIAKLSTYKSTHISLVSFSSGVSRTNNEKDSYDSFSTRTNFQLPNIELSSGNNKCTDVTSAINPSPVFGETNTGDAIEAATKMLQGSGHRKSVAKSIVILTDGRPNPPGSAGYFTGLKQAEAAAKKAG
ncbi:MAG: VWA domain-containing protein, partial [Cyanobacteria bacterium]|nr:VWA domain-containing protein [Cyanobacteriota bacterium]